MTDYQKKLEKSVEQAEQANVAKTDFLRRMSHDIRTPINGIRGMVDICRYNIGNQKKQEECLDKIMLSSTFLMELVNDVLDMNKLESGQIRLEEKPFSIHEILKEVETVVGMAATEHGITLTVKMGEIIHENLLGSSLHIRQILQNIASNAVKYNKTNGKIYEYAFHDDKLVKNRKLSFTEKKIGELTTKDILELPIIDLL